MAWNCDVELVFQKVKRVLELLEESFLELTQVHESRNSVQFEQTETRLLQFLYV